MKLTRRIICIALAVCLVFTLGSTAFAASISTTAPHFNTYTILGDSNAAGYGLAEYEQLADAKHSVLADCEVINSAYGAMIADAIGADTTYWRAHSAWRTTDFLRVVGYPGFSYTVEPDSAYKAYLDWPRSWVKNGQLFITAFGQTSFNQTALKNSIHDSVAASDIVTVQFGSNDIFTYMLMALIEKWGDIFSEVLDASSLSEAIEIFNNAVNACPSSEKKLLLADVVNACNEGLRMFKENFPKVIDYIKTTANNPDIKILVLGLLNPTDDLLNYSDVIDVDIFTASDLTCAKADSFLKNLCANDKNCTFVNIDGCDGYGLPAMNWDKLTNGTDMEAIFAAIKIVHPSELGHQEIAGRIIDTLNASICAPEVTASYTSGLNRVKLSWDKIADAKSYRVYRSTSENGNYSLVGSPISCSFTDLATLPGHTYYYKVVAVMNVKGTLRSAAGTASITAHSLFK